MRKTIVLLLALSVAAGCTWRKSQKEEESPNIGKEVVVTLTTGDQIEGKISRETEKDITILGKKGEITLLKTQIAAVEPPAPKKEPEFRPRPLPPLPDSPTDQGPMPYAAIRGKKVFHKATCTLLRGQPASKVDLYKTRQEAISEGLRPCGTCNP